MTPLRDCSTTAGDKRLIDAWAARHLALDDAERGRADRLASDRLMIEKAMALETWPAPSVPLLEGPEPRR